MDCATFVFFEKGAETAIRVGRESTKAWFSRSLREIHALPDDEDGGIRRFSGVRAVGTSDAFCSALGPLHRRTNWPSRFLRLLVTRSASGCATAEVPFGVGGSGENYGVNRLRNSADNG
jgi:hypothetical protein